MSWLSKLLPPKIKKLSIGERRGVPEGLWSKCLNCETVLYQADFKRNLKVCPKCGHHGRLNARERLNITLDDGDRHEIGKSIAPKDPLKFVDGKRYIDRIKSAKKRTNEEDALVVIKGQVNGLAVVCAAFEFEFLGGSMGSVVGEKFSQGVAECCRNNLPLICFAASGGARMQEGVLSLLQMAKTAAALTKLAKKKLPFISVLTDPTMGGVSASFAMLGDIIVAEPNALIGFAGPRVIEQTVNEKLPDGFQRSEFLLKHGAIDMIVDRRQLRETVYDLVLLLRDNQLDIKK